MDGRTTSCAAAMDTFRQRAGVSLRELEHNNYDMNTYLLLSNFRQSRAAPDACHNI